MPITDHWRGRLPRSFFAQETRKVARLLVGARLIHIPSAGRDPYVARIVETEAYCGPEDAACHARFGVTPRTQSLFGQPGHAYVFLIYGMYDCFNIVTGRGGAGHAVLIRACEPVFGFEERVRLDGPGRLTRAMELSRAHNALDLTGDTVFVCAREARPTVRVSARVGVGYAGADAERPWRFFDADSPHVSRPAAKLIGRGESSAHTQEKRKTQRRSVLNRGISVA